MTDPASRSFLKQATAVSAGAANRAGVDESRAATDMRRILDAKSLFFVAGVLLAVWNFGIPGTAADPSATGGSRPAETRPPNIVLIMADDVGREALGCYGGTSYRTPQIDALASTGMRFTHCYSMPVCHPSRRTIMTGQYPLRNPSAWGSWPKGVGTFAHLLKQAGYATAVAGKWQLALLKNNPDHAGELGFDESAVFGWHEGPRYHNPMIYRTGVVWKEKQKPDVYGPEVYTDFLIDFMRRHRDRPFLAYYSMALCHEIADDFSPVPPPAPDGHYLSFAEMVADMDRMVGRLVAAIDRLGLRGNTVILLTTDNGSPRSYLTRIERRGKKTIRHHEPVFSTAHGVEIRGGKGQLTDAGTRVPLIANWPGTTPGGRVCDDLIDFSDFLPTLAELAGAQLPKSPSMDGQPFAAQLRGKPGDPRPWVFCEHGGRRWVRTQRWKLYGNGKFYDMDSDPTEQKPLAAGRESAEATAARTRLQSAIDSLRAQSGKAARQ